MTTYYVGPGGNNANAGTSWALRKLTLNGAEDIPVSAGDTVYVGPGTYRELLTVDVSGSAGSPITYIGDYTGANTSGTKGIVRITGSDDDLSATRANCITSSGKSYRTFTGFHMDTTTSNVAAFLQSGANNHSDHTITNCTFQNASANALLYFRNTNAGNTVTNCTVTACAFLGGRGQGCAFEVTTEATGLNNLVQSCLFMGNGGAGLIGLSAGGLTALNCTFWGVQGNAFQLNGTGTALATVNNCIFQNCATGASAALRAQTAATITENYNTFYGNVTDRSNVTAGANSVTRPANFDVRWFFEAINSGRMVTPFDLASYSTLVEYNSGTGAPATDLRAKSVVGTYREWGALEYDANYRTQGPVSIAPIGGIG